MPPVLCLLLFSVPRAVGHPHIFIDLRLSVVCKDDIFDGFFVEWVFGDFFAVVFLVFLLY